MTVILLSIALLSIVVFALQITMYNSHKLETSSRRATDSDRLRSAGTIRAAAN